ncbi:flavin reductase family protein [Actinomadura kijaniata]|uniref:flavin reductase family protein n=1 Tax=Actinomadura kijaniata TaxID=46161 RepID=UPI003F539B10
MADHQGLRKAFGAFATGVTVVTVGGDDPHGMTANSFTSVSLDPPLVLICVRRDAVMHDILGRAGHFGVSVLSGGQEAAARHFADRSRDLGAAEFESVDWLPGPLTGVPLLSGALVGFECEVWRSHDGGDHTIFLGRLLSMERQTGGEDTGGQAGGDDVLVFFDGRFRVLEPDRGEVTA